MTMKEKLTAPPAEPTERECDEFVRREVVCCVSSLVSTLAAPWRVDSVNETLDELHEQAQEIAAPVDDWEEAAIQAGWEIDPAARSTGGVRRKLDDGNYTYALGWEDALDGGEPYQWEVFEHWVITPYFADALERHGEKVDRDFASLTVWARTTTGQAIASDGVVRRIVAEMKAELAELMADSKA